jgi:sortase (surface protein transpeptidase)
MTISKKGQFCDIIYLEDKHNQRVYAVKNVKTRDEVTGDQWKEVMRRIENEI